MNKIIVTMFLVLTGPFGLQLANASDAGLDKANEFSKIPVSRMSARTHADGFETYYGERFKIEEVVNAKEDCKAKEILEQHQIELQDGAIFYPEEVKFALRERRGGAVGVINKAPQTTD